MKVAAKGPLAMVLPLPVRGGAAEGAVRFVDLSDYPDFFDDLSLLFAETAFWALAASGRGSLGALEVYEIGAYEASFGLLPHRALARTRDSTCRDLRP